MNNDEPRRREPDPAPRWHPFGADLIADHSSRRGAELVPYQSTAQDVVPSPRIELPGSPRYRPSAHRKPQLPGTHRAPGRAGPVNARTVAVGTLGVCVAVLAFCMLVRLWDRPVGTFSVLVQTIAPLLTLPALVLLAAAVLLRRRVMAVLCAVLTVLGLTWLAPEVLPGSGVRPVSAGAVTLRMFSANLLDTSVGTQDVADRIRREAADVVVLLEYSDTSSLGLGPALSPYSYSFVMPDGGKYGIGIWSRYPLREPRVIRIDGRPLLTARVSVADRSVRLWAVRVVSPRSGSVGTWRRQLATLREQVDADGGGPVVMAGTFNATRSHRDFRALLGAGLQDARDSVGGWQATWPAGGLQLPLLRLDHLLVGGGVRVARLDRQLVPGSDHLALASTVIIP